MSFLAGGKWGPVLGFSIVGGMFTILAIVIYMLACVACIGYFTRKAEGMPHKNVLLHIVCPVLGIIVFLVALYAQYFSFDQLFKPAFTTFPLNWIGWSALIWLVLGIVVTLYMSSEQPEALDRATHAFGGEADELPGDGQPESMATRPLAVPTSIGRFERGCPPERRPCAGARARVPGRGEGHRANARGVTDDARRRCHWRPILGGLTTS